MSHTGSPKILVGEDDDNLRVALADNLEDEGYVVLSAETIARARAILDTDQVDLVVLDLMLPDGDGYSLCRGLRERDVSLPVLMLTARSLEEDLLKGFDVGADDYLTKPFRLREFLARTKALLRRGGGDSCDNPDFCGYRIDTHARTLYGPEGQVIALTRKEFDLLMFLFANRNRVVARDYILHEIWGQRIVVELRTIDNFISKLRKKLDWTPSSRFRFATVRGIGYRMEVDD